MTSMMSATTPVLLELPYPALQLRTSTPPQIGLAEPDMGELWDVTRPIASFDPITLDQMDEVALMNRTDTKYVVGRSLLSSVLSAVRPGYRVLEINGRRLNRYQTVYFDTEDFALYRQHHSGKRLRFKVRSREYVESGLSFLEVKSKGKRDRTVKDRIRTSHLVTEWGEAVSEMKGLKTRIDFPPMEAKLVNNFVRVTLVGKSLRERVTIDLNLDYSAGGVRCGFPQLVVVEVKQDGMNRSSELIRQMRDHGIRPGGFSKYCVGVSMLFESVKHNRFKPNLRLIETLERSECDAERVAELPAGSSGQPCSSSRDSQVRLLPCDPGEELRVQLPGLQHGDLLRFAVPDQRRT